MADVVAPVSSDRVATVIRRVSLASLSLPPTNPGLPGFMMEHSRRDNDRQVEFLSVIFGVVVLRPVAAMCCSRSIVGGS